MTKKEQKGPTPYEVITAAMKAGARSEEQIMEATKIPLEQLRRNLGQMEHLFHTIVFRGGGKGREYFLAESAETMRRRQTKREEASMAGLTASYGMRAGTRAPHK